MCRESKLSAVWCGEDGLDTPAGFDDEMVIVGGGPANGGVACTAERERRH